MKSLAIFSFLAASILMIGCRKSDNPKIPDLVEIPLPLIVQTEGGTQIPGDAPTTFAATFTVENYYKFGLQPKSMDVVVVKNGDRANPKILEEGITSFPATISVNGQDLIDLFGAPIALGDVFEVGANVTTPDGNTYAAFPVGGETYAPGISNLAGINTSLRFAAPCKFEPEAYTEGDYEVLVDEWADYAVGAAISVAKIDDTHYSFKYAADNANPIIMIVDPVDNSITVEPTMYGDYGGLEVTATGVPGPDSQVDPCNTTFSVVLNHVYSGGNLGNYKIVLKKL